ncbi:MAG: hypothetical protein JWR80_5361 [Bradyrhizobium sp.]|nr:hypothetical protein [Bradyrhizobium sp.]
MRGLISSLWAILLLLQPSTSPFNTSALSRGKPLHLPHAFAVRNDTGINAKGRFDDPELAFRLGRAPRLAARRQTAASAFSAFVVKFVMVACWGDIAHHADQIELLIARLDNGKHPKRVPEHAAVPAIASQRDGDRRPRLDRGSDQCNLGLKSIIAQEKAAALSDRFVATIASKRLESGIEVAYPQRRVVASHDNNCIR